MKNLVRINDQPDLFLRLIVSRMRFANRNVLNTNLSHILARYLLYETTAPLLENMVATPNTLIPHTTILQNAYSPQRLGLSDLCIRILAVQDGPAQARCQLCGIKKAEELDHYMPETLYPEFAVFITNLVPICNTCNKKKSSQWLNAKQLRQVINLYFDILPDEKFLYAEINIDADTPVVGFKLKRSPNMSKYTHDLLLETYRVLGLKGRMLNEAASYCQGLREEVQTRLNRNSQGTNTQYELNTQYDIVKDSLGLNNWESAILDDARNNQDFINWCKT